MLDSLGKPYPDTDPMTWSIDELEVSCRTWNALRKANISTVSELMTKGPAGLLQMKNFGRRSLAQLEDELQRHGLTFRKMCPHCHRKY